MSKIGSDKKFFLVMFLAMLTWGGSWASAKIVANITAPEVLIFWRFLATFAAFVPVLFYIKKPLKPDRKSFLFILLGSALLVAYNKLFFQGLRTGLAGAGSVVVTTINPIFTFVFSMLLFRRKISGREKLGLFIGLIGGLVLLQVWQLDTEKIFKGGNLYFLLAAVAWSLLTLVTQNSGNISSLVFSFYIYGFSTFFDLFLALPYGVTDVFHAGAPFWINIIYLSVIVTTFGTTAYFFASTKVGAGKASSFMFMVPTSAVLISWLILGEVPRFFTIAGGVLALAAVYLINTKPREAEKPGMADGDGQLEKIAGEI